MSAQKNKTSTEVFIALPLDARKASMDVIMSKSQNKIPIIILFHSKLRKPSDLKKTRYLVAKGNKVSFFVAVLRKNMPDTDDTTSLYLFSNKKLLAGSTVLEQVYEADKSMDGVLYLTLADVPSFG